MTRAELEQLADKTLLIIRARPEQAFNAESLAKKLKVTPEQFNAATKILKAWEYKVNLSGGKITFLSAPDLLSATEISYGLKSKIIGKQVHSFNSIRSTHPAAHQLAEKGAPEGTIVTAEKQTLGLGRMGRSWHSPERIGIYLTIILRPRFSPEKAPGLSVMTALAVAEVLDKYCPDRVQIKWPNDVKINDKKVTGVLPDLDSDKNKINYIVVSIGINVNQTNKDFPNSIGQAATSVRIESGKKVDRIELIKKILLSFEKEYKRYQKYQLGKSLNRIRKFSSLIGKNISVQTGGKIISGKAVDIDKTGSLIMESGGYRHVISSGEVTVLKN